MLYIDLMSIMPPYSLFLKTNSRRGVPITMDVIAISSLTPGQEADALLLDLGIVEQISELVVHLLLIHRPVTCAA